MTDKTLHQELNNGYSIEVNLCRDCRGDFDNGFSLILRDNKSASYRSKQRDLMTVGDKGKRTN